MGSRTARRLDPRAAWGQAEHLLADICDCLILLCYELGGCHGPKPRLVRRPEAPRRDALEGVSSERVRSLLFDKRK